MIIVPEEHMHHRWK